MNTQPFLKAHPTSKAGQVVQSFSKLSLEYFLGKRSHDVSGPPYLCLATYVVKYFSSIQPEFPLLQLVPPALSLHLQEESGSVFSTDPQLGGWRQPLGSPYLLSSRLSKPRFLSLPSYIMCSSPEQTLWLSTGLLPVGWCLFCTVGWGRHAKVDAVLQMSPHKCDCGGLTMADCQMPTELLSHSPSSTAQGEKRRWKSSFVELKTGRSLTN